MKKINNDNATSINPANASFFTRLSIEIDNYLASRIEISEGVFFSQYQLIKRLMKFKNRDLMGTKIADDLSYIYYFDIISPRVDNEVKNLRFDTKNILVFSQNPTNDFPAVFISNAMLRQWLMEHGEDDKLKAVVEEFTANGNVIFKKVQGGYETTDPLNTYITNQKAESVEDTAIIERHDMIASEIKEMTSWNNVDEVIKECGNKTFNSTVMTTPVNSTSKHYEIFEYTGEVSELEFNELKGIPDGDANTYFLAKVIVAGVTKSGKGERYVLFAEKLTGDMCDYYLDAHRGRYEGRFWRVGMYEMLFDHQIRANQIANDIARGLEWASRVIFRSKDSQVLQNIRADLDNGDVVITEDLAQVDVRLHNMDQLIADWNRLMSDVNALANSFEIVMGEMTPYRTPFRAMALLDQNAAKLFVDIRQKLTLSFRRVFREWVLPQLIKQLSGQDIFRITGDNDMLEQFREIAVENWYMQNLVKIGPHTQQVADAIKQEKLAQMQKVDPVIQNSSDIWKGVMPRLLVTITGENYDGTDYIQDITALLGFETDPVRLDWMLDRIYKIRGIPVPPKSPQQPPSQMQPDQTMSPQQGMQNGRLPRTQPQNQNMPMDVAPARPQRGGGRPGNNMPTQ